MGANATSKSFVHGSDSPWEEVGDGVRRKVLAYDRDLMLVEVRFDKGAVGEPHAHPHVQCSLVKAGSFEVVIGDRTERLSEGDSFMVPGGVVHSVVALSDGALVDAFTPMREDFTPDS